MRLDRNTLALVAICLAALMFGLEISSVPVILPTLETLLHGDFFGMQWIMNAYTIACTTVLMAVGTLADRYGRKRVFLVSVAAFGLTSLVCGLAASVPALIAARFLQGLAGGAILICSIAVLSHQFDEPAARARAFSAWGVIAGVGLGFGPIIGGTIVALLSWQWVFLVHVVIAALVLALAWHSVAESRDPEAKHLDVAGIATLSLAVFGFSWVITQGPQIGFASVTAIGIAAAALVSLVAFVIVERRRAHPMFDFSVFRIHRFSGAIFGSIGMNFSFWPFMIYLPIYFQAALGYDAVATGFSLLAYTLPTLIVPPFGERLALRYGANVVIPAGLFTIGAGFIAMTFGSTAAHASWLTMLPGCLIAGIGLGLINTPVTNTTTGSVPSTRAGMASGIDMSARLITLAINIAMMGFILIEGIAAHLRGVLHGVGAAESLPALAKAIAAGNPGRLARDFPQFAASAGFDAVAHAALVQGFGWTLLYGGFGVWLLAAGSFAVFRRGAFASRSAKSCDDGLPECAGP